MTERAVIEQVTIPVSTLLDSQLRLNQEPVSAAWMRLAGLDDEFDVPIMTAELMQAIDGNRDVVIRLVEVTTNSGRVIRKVEATDGVFLKEGPTA